MKSFLLIACTAGLLAGAALPAAAESTRLDAYDRPIGTQPYYGNNSSWNGQGGSLKPLPYPAYGHGCGANAGWSGGGWGGGWNGGWGGAGYHQPKGGWNNGYYRPRAQLPTQTIAYCVQQQRFSNIKDIDFDDGFYKVYARDPYGRKVKLVVDPYTGRIVQVKYR